MEARDSVCSAQLINVGGLNVAYHVDGPKDAPVVVCIHGSMNTRKVWIYPLAPTHVRIVALTRLGYGESDNPDLKTYGYDMVVTIVKEILDALSVDKFHVIGHSAGGPGALACKAMLPERCMKCLVISGDSEYATAPTLNTADFGCCTPGRCCGSCGLCCVLPCVLKPMLGGCCTCCCPCFSSYKADPIKAEPPKELVKQCGLTPGDMDDLAQLGDQGQQYLAYHFKMMDDSTHKGHKLNGVKSDTIAQNKAWPFKVALTDGTVSGADVEIWTSDLDKTVKRAVSEYTQSLIPGSTLHVASGLSHMGLLFPNFMAQRFAALVAVKDAIGDAPKQEQMQ